MLTTCRSVVAACWTSLQHLHCCIRWISNYLSISDFAARLTGHVFASPITAYFPTLGTDIDDRCSGDFLHAHWPAR
uniref:Uncharacterized protein n=1 Tax=Aegilops tauschii subsp. strangulata TaxID=200361 RepID=A0A453TD92_AEGTS